MAVTHDWSDTLTGLRRTPLCWTPLDSVGDVRERRVRVPSNRPCGVLRCTPTHERTLMPDDTLPHQRR
jgi:hypothetical protein